MGAGVSAIDSLDGAVAQFAKAEGLTEVHRPNLSLERVKEWTQQDVCRAIEAVHSSFAPRMCRALEAYDTPITGAFLLALTPKQLEATLAKLKLRPDETAWASRVVLRLQQRRVIVGRSRREAPLPPGWTVVASRSRPGELSYKCTATGVRCAERPTAEAATAHMERGQAPLPQGWLPLPSQRWPGEVVYMHVKHKNLHLGWRPQAVSLEDLQPASHHHGALPLDSRPKTAHAFGRNDSSSTSVASAAATTTAVAWAPNSTSASSTMTFQQAAVAATEQAAEHAAALKFMRAQTSVGSLCRALDRIELRHSPKSHSRGPSSQGNTPITLAPSSPRPPSSPSATLMNLTKRANNDSNDDNHEITEPVHEDDAMKQRAARMLAPRIIPQRRRRRPKDAS